MATQKENITTVLNMDPAENITLEDILYLVQGTGSRRDRKMTLRQLAEAIADAVETGKVRVESGDVSSYLVRKIIGNQQVGVTVGASIVGREKVLNLSLVEKSVDVRFLADSSVSEDKLIKGSVTEDKISDGAVTAKKIGENIVDSSGDITSIVVIDTGKLKLYLKDDVVEESNMTLDARLRSCAPVTFGFNYDGQWDGGNKSFFLDLESFGRYKDGSTYKKVLRPGDTVKTTIWQYGSSSSEHLQVLVGSSSGFDYVNLDTTTDTYSEPRKYTINYTVTQTDFDHGWIEFAVSTDGSGSNKFQGSISLNIVATK